MDHATPSRPYTPLSLADLIAMCGALNPSDVLVMVEVHNDQHDSYEVVPPGSAALVRDVDNDSWEIVVSPRSMGMGS